MARQTDWLSELKETLPRYLNTLEVPDEPGRFVPCVDGVTELARRLVLGFSCLALKCYFSLGLWETLSSEERATWIGRIRSFQVDEAADDDAFTSNAFVDIALTSHLMTSTSVHWHRRFLARLTGHKLTYVQKVVLAETKQAIATLAEVDEVPARRYRGPWTTPADVERYLARLD